MYWLVSFRSILGYKKKIFSEVKVLNLNITCELHSIRKHISPLLSMILFGIRGFIPPKQPSQLSFVHKTRNIYLVSRVICVCYFRAIKSQPYKVRIKNKSVRLLFIYRVSTISILEPEIKILFPPDGKRK